MRSYKFIYGPVSSWRLGISLGIDPVYTGTGKVCPFDCIYCQAGKTKFHARLRKRFIPEEKILNEIQELPDLGIDYITFSGAGEPTLALNIGKIIDWIKDNRKEKIAVLTNAAFLSQEGVIKDLKNADLVVAKLDAASEAIFKTVSKPVKGLTLKNIIKGIKYFRKHFKGKLALQMMFLKENKHEALSLARIAREIKPDIIYINTPTRPSRRMALSKKEMAGIKKEFKGLKTLSVYDGKDKKVKTVIKSKIAKRRGK